MKKNCRKKRHQGKTRLTSRNALNTLNGLIEFTNALLSEGDRLHSVNTPRDLFELRQKMKVYPTGAANNGDDSAGTERIRKVEVVPTRVIQALATIATNAWRTRNKMTDEDTGEAKDEMKRAYRHIEALFEALSEICLLYTSDAADDLLCVDLGGRRIIKKKKQDYTNSQIQNMIT